MEMVLTVLPFLVLLACPIMMALCFLGMRKMGSDAPPSLETQAMPQLPAERVAALQRQLEAIQAELTTLQHIEAQAPPVAVGGQAHPSPDIAPGAAHATQIPA